LWREVADARYFQGDNRIIWRLCVPPTTASAVVAAIQRVVSALAYYDWGGGLIWLSIDVKESAAAATVVRAALLSGHATLIRAPAALCLQIPPFQPQAAALNMLNRRVRSALDPLCVLNPGRIELE
jgi:glycolate oxidase FAD binding subunit